jgi:hypothetical protein
MKIKIIAHYEADPSEGFQDGCGFVEVASEELNLSYDEILAKIEAGSSLEETLELTIDDGGDDDWYEMDLPDYADSKSEALANATKVFIAAIALIEKESSKRTTSENDVVVCVQEYPESGDQAVVTFINLTTLEADTHPGCQQYAKELRLAMKDGRKIGSAQEFICGGCVPQVNQHETKPPCMVQDSVTLYET